MELTEKDKALLVKWGEEKADFEQIEETMNGCEFEFGNENSTKKIGREKAIELLGREEFLRGIVRSAFHRTACNGAKNGGYVYFNANKLWGEWIERGRAL